MATNLEYAQLAGRVYSGSAVNRIPVPKGWKEDTWQNDALLGFSGGIYVKGSEVVVSYTGTNEMKGADFVAANLPLGVGLPSPQ